MSSYVPVNLLGTSNRFYDASSVSGEGTEARRSYNVPSFDKKVLNVELPEDIYTEGEEPYHKKCDYLSTKDFEIYKRTVENNLNEHGEIIKTLKTVITSNIDQSFFTIFLSITLSTLISYYVSYELVCKVP